MIVADQVGLDRLDELLGHNVVGRRAVGELVCDLELIFTTIRSGSTQEKDFTRPLVSKIILV